MVGNVASICLDDSNTITWSANYTGPSDSINWTFTGANITTAQGTGPIVATYAIAGVYSTTVQVYYEDSLYASTVVGVRVSQIAPISIVTASDTLCESDSAMALVGIPAGGVFSGTGVNGDFFDPDAAGPGDHTITYILTQGACSDTTTTTINVKVAPNTVLLAKGFPDVFAGIPTYTTCDSTGSLFFEFHTITDPTSYTSYTIDFGDGTTSSGTTFPTAPVYVGHTYAGAGLYSVVLTLNGANGCSRSDQINVFIGVSPALGFTRSGTNNFCLPRVDSGYVEMCFNILNTASNDSSTYYVVSYNDGSPDDIFQHPPPDSVCHRFYEGSCGYTATGSPNSFEVSITAVNPCGSNTFSNSPIYISEPPEAEIQTDPRACVDQIVSIIDSSDEGTLILGSGACVNGDRLIWSISPSTYTLVGPPSDLGLTFGNTDPTFWFGGAQTLNVRFNQQGIYTITQVAGNSSQCGLDTAMTSICIDTIPISDFTLNDDTICVGESITASFNGNLFSLCDTLDLLWEVIPPVGVTTGVTSAYDTVRTFNFTQSGVYDIVLTASNICGVEDDTIRVLVQGIPFVTLPADTAICGLTTLDFSTQRLAPTYDSNYATLSYMWDVVPATGWNFTSGTTAASEFPIIEFTSIGTYTVTITTSNNCGNLSDDIIVTLTEEPQLIAVYTPFQDTLICSGSSLAYGANSLLGSAPYTYTWGSPGDGILNNTDSIFLANLTQDTTIFVTVTDNLGCSDSTAFTISVGPIPQFDAGADVTLCYSDSVQLSPSIVGGLSPFTYSWSPDTGLSANNIVNPWRSPLDTSIVYVLTITDSIGCTFIDSVAVNVHPLVNMDAGNDEIICINQGIQSLGGTPSGGVWTGTGVVGGNSFDPVVSGLGTYTLTYTYTDPNACIYIDSLIYQVILQPSLDFTFDNDSGCTALIVNISDSTGVSGHQWYANDSLFSTVKNPSITLANTSSDQDSTVAIKLVFTAGSGCVDSLTKNVVIHPKPLAAFSLPTEACAGDAISPVQNSSFKGATASFAWTVNSNSVQINDTSLASPTFTFPDFQSQSDSVYTFELILISVDGCSDTISDSIVVHSRPVSNFSLPAPACTPLTFNPSDSSIGGNLSYAWAIAPLQNVNVNNANSSNPDFSFITPASDSIVYTITLTVTDSNGCTDAFSDTYTSYPQPQMAFTPSQDSGCTPFIVTFSNASTSGISGQAGSLTYQWDLGNGTTSTDTNTQATYLNNGTRDTTYYIQLVATNSLGCTDTLRDSIVVHPDPRAVMNFSSFTDCAPYTIDGSVLNANLFPLTNNTYIWNVYDVNGVLLNTYNGPSGINHTLNTGGDSIFVELVATSINGCDNDTSAQQLFYTITNPVADFTSVPDSGCSPLLVSFMDNSTPGVNHQWFVNGTAFSTNINPSLTLNNSSFTTDSLVEIKLLITAGSGCSDSITKTVVVHPKPNASFSINPTTCASDTLTPVNNSNSQGSTTYLWSASSSAVIISDSSLAQPNFIFPDNQSGTDSTYTIQLIVTSAEGCSDTTSQNVLVYTRPVADFNLTPPSCAPIILSPVDNSSGSFLSYNWSVSPTVGVTASNAATASPQFDFLSPTLDTANYRISLTITDVNGCSDTMSQIYTIYPKPTAAFSTSVADSCGPLTISFSNTSTPNISSQNLSNLSFQWDFGNGNTSVATNPQETYFNSGVVDSTYVISLIVSNNLGCSDTVIDSIIVHPDPRAVANFSSFTDCAPYLIDSTVINASVFPVANNSYLWNIYDPQGNLLSQQNGANGINYTLITGGDSVYIQLITQSPFGCANDTSAQQLFYTIVNPTADFSVVPDTGCSPFQLNIVNNSTPGVSYEWFLNGNSFSILQNPQLTLTNLSLTTDSLVEIKLRITAGSGCLDSISRTVVIQPQPVAQFSINPTACSLDSLQATNTSISSGPLTYNWSASNPNIIISNPGDAQPYFTFPDNQSGFDSTYTIQLIVSSAAGCMDTTTQSVIVYSRPLADFILPAAGCAPLSINPVDNSGGSFLNYNWSVSPTTGVVLTGANGSNPQLDFSIPAQDSAYYSITLSITDANGCSDSIVKNYAVYPLPTANFSASSLDSCGPLTITFSNLSASNISGQDRSTMSFLWDFGNGNTSTDSVPVQNFLNPGLVDSTYIVQLISTNSLGCADTIVDTVIVRPNPLAEIDSLIGINCAPFQIDSTAARAVVYTGANQTYIWNVIDPISNQVIQSYNGATGLNYPLLNDNDSVFVQLITTSAFGCRNDTASIMFYTFDDSNPGFTVSDSIGCHPLTVNLLDTSQAGASRQWFINNVASSTLVNPTFVLNNPSTTSDTTYRITMISTVGNTSCDDSITRFITVYALPDPGFSHSEVCIGNSTQFSNSTSTIDTILQWFWDFGDGNTDTVQNPSHVYGSFGTYYVQLTATDSRGCSQTIGDSVIVRPNPVADFVGSSTCGPDTVCIGQAFTLTDLSTVPALGGNITSWQWDILNDGSFEYSTQNPLHTFNGPGLYDIKLVIETQYTCPDSIVRQIFVQDSLVPYFVTDTNANCGPLDIIATDSSTGLIENYFWELYTVDTAGNQTSIYTSNQQNPNPIPTLLPSYANDTTYVLELTVSNCCETATFSRQFVLKPIPVANFAILPDDTVCISDVVQFQLDGLVRGQPDSLILNFGDGTPPQTLFQTFSIVGGDTIWYWGVQTHSFPNPSQNDTIYTISLRASNECGDSTVTRDILVHPNLVQAFFTVNQNTGCEDLTVNFTDVSFGGNYTAWCFDYDLTNDSCNQFPAVGTNVSHTYTEPGTYTVAQFVNDGCSSDTAFTQITVFPSPTADYSSNNNICEGDTIFFTNLSTIANGAIVSYLWDFGDGNTSPDQDPFYVFDTAGVINVWLYTSSLNGCIDSISYPITIYDKPEVDFGFSTACLNEQPIQFSDSTTLNFGTVIQTVWDFGDGNSSVGINPTHTYAAPGAYTVSLIKTSSNGCTDSAFHTVNIFPEPTADFSLTRVSADSCGPNQQFQFTNLSVGAQGFLWDFRSNTNPNVDTLRDVNSPLFTYNDTGVYEIQLIATNGFGCTDTMVRSVVISPIPDAGFIADTFSGCVPLTVTFYDTTSFMFSGSAGITSRTWNMGDGTIITTADDSVTYTYNDFGNFDVTLTVETDAGCIDSITYDNYVNALPTPIPDFIITEINAKTLNFTNTTQAADPGVLYHWDFGDQTTSNHVSPSHIYNVDLLEADYAFEVCLTASNTYNCDSTICKLIEIFGYRLYVPNAFAPGLDGVGEGNIFLPKGHSLREYTLRIYDKWGNLLFITDKLDEDGKPAESWDGKGPSGRDLPMGAYAWKIDAVFDDGTVWQGKEYNNGVKKAFGTVTLLR